MATTTRFPGLLNVTMLVARKELLEGFRDRNTILYTVVIPLALYPVLFWLVIQASLLMEGRKERTEVRLEILAAESVNLPAGLRDALETGAQEGVDTLAVELFTTGNEAQARSRLTDGEAQAVLHLSGADRDPPAALLFFDSTESASEIARERVAERLPAFAQELRTKAVEMLGHSAAELERVAVEQHNVARADNMGAYLLSFILPMTLVFMTVMGAFFPAVDLTAGEKERNTIETTMIAPVSRRAIHQGKILAVCVSACLAATLNLLALALSAEHLLSMLGSGLRIDVPLSAYFLVAPLAVLFAFFVSALLTGVAALTRSFREGQALIRPAQLLFFIPAMVSTIPGIELTKALALVPVVNVVLAFKSILRGEVLLLEYALCTASLILFALLSIHFSLHVLSRESALTAKKSLSVRRLFTLFFFPAGTR